MKEATARIKINKLLEAAGWRFFPAGVEPANIRLEPSVTLKSSDLDALGENFEQTSKGFIDFLGVNSESGTGAASLRSSRSFGGTATAAAAGTAGARGGGGGIIGAGGIPADSERGRDENRLVAERSHLRGPLGTGGAGGGICAWRTRCKSAPAATTPTLPPSTAAAACAASCGHGWAWGTKRRTKSSDFPS